MFGCFLMLEHSNIRQYSLLDFKMFDIILNFVYSLIFYCSKVRILDCSLLFIYLNFPMFAYIQNFLNSKVRRLYLISQISNVRHCSNVRKIEFSLMYEFWKIQKFACSLILTVRFVFEFWFSHICKIDLFGRTKMFNVRSSLNQGPW